MEAQHNWMRLGWTVMAMGAVLALCSGHTAADTGNLLSNPGAELGMNGWSVIEGGGLDLQAAEHSDDAHSGDWYWWGGGKNDAEYTLAWQTVDVSHHAAHIDNGTVEANLSGYLGGYGGEDRDIAQLFMVFLDGQGGWVGEGGEAEVQVASGNYDEWTHVEGSALAPPGTRSILVKMRSIWLDGDVIDGYFDDLDLHLTMLPKLEVTSSVASFGEVYITSATNSSPADYNEANGRTLEFMNVGPEETALSWQLSSSSTWIKFGSSSGSLEGGDGVEVKVWLEPSGAPASLSGTIELTSTRGDSDFTVSAVTYRTAAAPSLEDPALGSNGRINVGVDESVRLGVASGTASHPSAVFAAYLWKKVQDQLNATQLDGLSPSQFNSIEDSYWICPAGGSPGEYTVYCETYETIGSSHGMTGSMPVWWASHCT
jgi:hypothetical protein